MCFMCMQMLEQDWRGGLKQYRSMVDSSLEDSPIPEPKHAAFALHNTTQPANLSPAVEGKQQTPCPRLWIMIKVCRWQPGRPKR